MNFATLMIGIKQDLTKFAGNDLKTFTNVEEGENKIIQVLNQNTIYYLQNLKLA